MGRAAARNCIDCERLQNQGLLMNTNHNLPDTLQALKDRYPYMFAG